VSRQVSGNLHSGAGRLQEAAETLRTRWQALREVWPDANARRFEEEELGVLAQALQAAFPAIAQMTAALQAMERDLTDERYAPDRLP
jgi:hypothetical protein